MLVHMIAHVCKLKPGKFTHIVNNMHIYENHIEALQEQIKRYESGNLPTQEPRLVINGGVQDFYDFTPDNVIVDNYFHMGKLPMVVAV